MSCPRPLGSSGKVPESGSAFRGSMRFRLGECEGKNNSVMPSRAVNRCTMALR